MGWQLVLPDWMGAAELAVAEEITGGRVVEIDGGGRVLVSRPNGEGGWIDMGYADQIEIEQADQLRSEFDRSLGEVLRANRLAMEFEAPFELVQDWAAAYPWATSQLIDWIERWSRHMLNGPAALMLREGWRSGPVRWSWEAIAGLTIGGGRWATDRLHQWFKEEYRRPSWAQQVAAYEQPFVDRVAQSQARYAEQWSRLLNGMASGEAFGGPVS